MQPFRSLAVWGRSHDLAVYAYRAVVRVRDREFPGIASQIRRAATSIPANIAEGCGQQTNKQFARFLAHAMGSAHELDY